MKSVKTAPAVQALTRAVARAPLPLMDYAAQVQDALRAPSVYPSAG